MCSSLNVEFTESVSQVQSTFEFHKSETGHAIENQNPMLIKLPQIDISKRNHAVGKMIALTLREICKLDNTVKTLVIGHNINELSIVSYSLSLIKNLKFDVYAPESFECNLPSKEEKRSILEKFNQNTCILADNSAVKGLEAQRIVIFANHQEYFLRHVFVEVIARAHVNVYILLYKNSSENVSTHEDTLGKLLESLVEKKLLDEVVVAEIKDYANWDKRPFYGDKCKRFEINTECNNTGLNDEKNVEKHHEIFITKIKRKISFKDKR